jgi:hypothetical protein
MARDYRPSAANAAASVTRDSCTRTHCLADACSRWCSGALLLASASCSFRPSPPPSLQLTLLPLSTRHLHPSAALMAAPHCMKTTALARPINQVATSSPWKCNIWGIYSADISTCNQLTCDSLHCRRRAVNPIHLDGLDGHSAGARTPVQSWSFHAIYFDNVAVVRGTFRLRWLQQVHVCAGHPGQWRALCHACRCRFGFDGLRFFQVTCRCA